MAVFAMSTAACASGVGDEAISQENGVDSASQPIIGGTPAAKGEFPWVEQDSISGLNAFYNNRPLNVKFGVAYPGFNTFYQQGGWGGPTWTLAYNGTSLFGQTMDLAKNSGVNWIQLATWNDYGEGTMIEPTREFGYGFLTTLQQKLGVPYTQTQLELVAKLYDQRKQYAGNSTRQSQLNDAFNAFVALQPDKAASILNGTGGTTSNPTVLNNGFESGMANWSTWSPNGTAAAAFTETYNGGYNSANHLTHYSAGAFETWTYQTFNGLPNGTYRVRGQVRKGGAFGFSRLQAKTCASCTPAATDLGTYSAWTQVDSPSIAVTAGYLEIGLHTQATSGSSFVHLDNVELIRQ